MWYPEYREEMSKSPTMQQPYIEDKDQILGVILFNKNSQKIQKTQYIIFGGREKGFRKKIIIKTFALFRKY